MTTETMEKSAAPAPETVPGAAFPFAGIDWKGRPESIAAMYGDLLSGTADLLRKQADLLTDLASCKDISQALSIQTTFAQSVWADALQGTQRSFSAVGKSLTGNA